ncbi:hypothetical protein [Flavobacterium xinjiangense]|uniref:Uncharacterized protein n=1 Tax=Flavobacterium xinjiangense TaxID=178356 RepID=A0A1M7L1R9_9FLAO|nr:hypothetical protein [Flavobacterium xinjiangense]SHM71792.1 hypothetical protein SAMN05216269_106154 [Flavobacterium xinjiangense]
MENNTFLVSFNQKGILTYNELITGLDGKLLSLSTYEACIVTAVFIEGQRVLTPQNLEQKKLFSLFSKVEQYLISSEFFDQKLIKESDFRKENTEIIPLGQIKQLSSVPDLVAIQKRYVAVMKQVSELAVPTLQIYENSLGLMINVTEVANSSVMNFVFSKPLEILKHRLLIDCSVITPVSNMAGYEINSKTENGFSLTVYSYLQGAFPLHGLWIEIAEYDKIY